MPPEAPTVPPEAPEILGRVVGERYRVVGKLGEGGMGAVYLAEHMAIEKRVALKILHPSFAKDPSLRERFLREAKAAARIRHPNVVDITDFGATDTGIVFIVMELLEGRDLAQVLKEDGALSWHQVKPLVKQVCSALSAAHGQGVIHRDIKPENVFFVTEQVDDEAIQRVKVVDFGIAKLIHDRNQPKLTMAGVVHGTPGFIAPEQFQGGEVDHRADIYSVSVLAYTLVTGKRPFAGENVLQVLTLQIAGDPIPPSQVDVDLNVPDALDEILGKGMAVNPSKRHATMAELSAAFEEVVAVTPTVPPSSEAKPRIDTTLVTPIPRRGKALLVGLAALVAALVAVAVGLGVGTVLFDEDDPAPVLPVTVDSGPDAFVQRPSAPDADQAAVVTPDSSSPDMPRPAPKKVQWRPRPAPKKPEKPEPKEPDPKPDARVAPPKKPGELIDPYE